MNVWLLVSRCSFSSEFIGFQVHIRVYSQCDGRNEASVA